MPVPTWEYTVHDQPRLAPANYQDLDPCVALRSERDWHSGKYVGSGFLVTDLIPGVWWYKEAMICGHCKRKRTLCIYLDNDVHQFSTNVKLEIVCLLCGKYTLYDGAD